MRVSTVTGLMVVVHRARRHIPGIPGLHSFPLSTWIFSGYFGVDNDIVWNIIEKETGPLLDAVNHILTHSKE